MSSDRTYVNARLAQLRNQASDRFENRRRLRVADKRRAPQMRRYRVSTRPWAGR